LQLRQLRGRLGPLTRQPGNLGVGRLTQLDPPLLRVLANSGAELSLGALIAPGVLLGLERGQLGTERIHRLLKLGRSSAELIEHAR
jgi:hypothetical protein